MDERALNTQLQRYGVTLNGACKQILILTDAAISSEDVRKHLARHGRLSEQMAAAFGLFFELKKQLRGRHAKAA